jgi:hypothetical protein
MTTNTKAPVSVEQMHEDMYLRMEEIVLLCGVITRRNLAHAFFDWAAHVEMLSSRIKPINANYFTADEVTPSIAELSLILRLPKIESAEELEDRYQSNMETMNTYISYLDLLIAKNKPVIHKQEQAA